MVPRIHFQYDILAFRTPSCQIELLSDVPDSFVENGRFTLSAREYAARLEDLLGEGWTAVLATTPAGKS